MRVITGTARGRRLRTLEGHDVRPTTDRVKEAVFSVIQFDIEGRRILDLFAGSGQMGIEALSRGASEAVFVDSSSASIAVVRENLRTCGLNGAAVVVQGDALSYLAPRAGRPEFDYAFLDPPYGKGILQAALPAAAAVMKPNGAIICESPAEEALPEEAGGFAIDRQYRYGRIKVTFYRIPQEVDADGGDDE
ncbi:MAG: 16S rRNA (guanine(966)-N(2))-methyltransferase RsmD [Clostridia bacterium]|nr:16S rRNA (guanine(966)-N(2))-methyltransferase RsmD [Clostridia bacterium]